MTKRTLLAYLAGAIDSDGTIGIKRNTYAVRVVKNSTQPTYSERLALRQVTPEIPELLKETFGGCVYITKPYSVNGKPLFSWQITDCKAFAALRALLPFLRVKRQQAENAIALRAVKTRSAKARIAKGRGHVGSAPRPLGLGVEMETLYLEAKRLNRVGI